MKKNNSTIKSSSHLFTFHQNISNRKQNKDQFYSHLLLLSIQSILFLLSFQNDRIDEKNFFNNHSIEIFSFIFIQWTTFTLRITNISTSIFGSNHSFQFSFNKQIWGDNPLNNIFTIKSCSQLISIQFIHSQTQSQLMKNKSILLLSFFTLIISTLLIVKKRSHSTRTTNLGQNNSTSLSTTIQSIFFSNSFSNQRNSINSILLQFIHSSCLTQSSTFFFKSRSNNQLHFKSIPISSSLFSNVYSTLIKTISISFDQQFIEEQNKSHENNKSILCFTHSFLRSFQLTQTFSSFQRKRNKFSFHSFLFIDSATNNWSTINSF